MLRVLYPPEREGCPEGRRRCVEQTWRLQPSTSPTSAKKAKRIILVISWKNKKV
jgi:hypothetical protein